ncbi:DNA-methyltransferase [Hymenobacter mucosus]|uniref:Methyltransferase n=1 Tax=Hymenobacter mucosus TaxID=1411120 RepID=A0A239BK37_9BACT|nr:site-specific DNA-methyltransferase [Hymenobacter mucosus]SNS07393.1 site-specific DNA-methyltransferase (adenine-specific) [Hymenobacter mucosus]
MLGPFEPNKIYNQDCLAALQQMPDNCVDVAITSPPYWGQRGDEGIGLEVDPRDYVNNVSRILLEVMRVLKPEGTLWLNIGDAYNTPINWRLDDRQYSSLGADGKGLNPENSAYTKQRGQRKPFIRKEDGWLQYGNLLALPYRIITNMCDKGIFFRGEVIWSKRKAMPEGNCRRPHRKHEPIYIFSKIEQHVFRVTPPVPSVWDLKADPSVVKKHTSVFPLSLPIACIEASGMEKGIVLDPFMGSGTTAAAAVIKGFDYIGFELDPENADYGTNRIKELSEAYAAEAIVEAAAKVKSDNEAKVAAEAKAAAKAEAKAKAQERAKSKAEAKQQKLAAKGESEPIQESELQQLPLFTA